MRAVVSILTIECDHT